MIRSVVAVAAASLFLAGTVNAAEFTGPRLEGRVGWDRVGLNLEPYGFTGDVHDDSVMFGAAIGYDYPIGGDLRFGVEAEIDFSDASFGATDGVNSGELEAKRDIGVSARLSGRYNENLLSYVKVGYSNARVSARVVESGVTTLSDSTNGDGFRVGLGGELALGEQLYAKAEYRYSNYEGGFDRNQVIAGLGFRF